MAETVLTVIDAQGQWSQTGAAVTMTALDNANGNKFLGANLAIVLVHNTSGGALTFQMTSQPENSTGRLGHVSQSLAAGEIRAFQVTKSGWVNPADGYVYLPSGQNAALKVGILKLR